MMDKADELESLLKKLLTHNDGVMVQARQLAETDESLKIIVDKFDKDTGEWLTLLKNTQNGN